jgi:hypothetical protein
LEIWNVGLNSIEKKNRGTSSIQLNILILQLTVQFSETSKIYIVGDGGVGEKILGETFWRRE